MPEVPSGWPKGNHPSIGLEGVAHSTQNFHILYNICFSFLEDGQPVSWRHNARISTVWLIQPRESLHCIVAPPCSTKFLWPLTNTYKVTRTRINTDINTEKKLVNKPDTVHFVLLNIFSWYPVPYCSRKNYKFCIFRKTNY